MEKKSNNKAVRLVGIILKRNNSTNKYVTVKHKHTRL